MSWSILLVRDVIKAWTEMAARVRLYMLTSNLTSLVPPQFSHWLQVRKVGTAYLFFHLLFLFDVKILDLVQGHTYVVIVRVFLLYT